MFIVEGTYNGKNLSKSRNYVSVSNSALTIENTNARVKLDKVISVDVLSQEFKTTTGGGVTGAGAGALLGFLVAGPVGTAIGAGMGSKKKEHGSDNTTIAIGFRNGDLWVCKRAAPSDIAKLKVAVSKNLRAPSAAVSNNQRAPSDAVSELLNPASLSKRKKTKSPKRNKTKSHQQQKVLNKPKKPDSNIFLLKKFKGRKQSATTKLPNLDFLQKLEKIEGVDSKALKLLSSTLKVSVKRYNNFQRVYFDSKLETEKEFDHIAIRILRNLIAQSNGLNLIEDKILSLNTEGKKLEEQLQMLSSKLEDYKKELSETGFFGKGDIKKKITTTQSEIKEIKSQITSNKRIRTNNQKKFDSKDSKVLRNIDNPLNQFELIFDTMFPEEKKPKTGLKSIKKLDPQFFLDTYLVGFDEIWDKKIKEDKEKRKKEKRLKENQAKEKKAKEEAEELKSKSRKKIDEKKQDSSIKERLTELQSLRDDNLITNEEYEISRKKILSSL